MSRLSRPLKILLAIIGVVLTVLLIAPDFLVKYLWMDELGYASVYLKQLGAQAGLFTVVLLVALAFFGLNFYYFMKQIPPLWATQWAEEGETPEFGGKPLTRKRLGRIIGAFAVLLSILFASGFAGRWDEFFRFAASPEYGMTDPVFGYDLSFYMLQLPFIESIQSGIVGLAFLGILVLVTAYVVIGEISIQDGRPQIRPSVVKHLAVNVAILLVGWTWGFYLDRYELLYSPSGAVAGASYVDLNIRLPALWMMVAATMGMVAIIVYNLFRYNLRMLIYGSGLYVFLLIAGLVLAPAAVTQLYVEPNELEAEMPYLEDNIEFTREAYDLTDVEDRPYDARQTLDMEQIQANEQTIQNVRLWDPRLLIDNYQQLQQIRLYYQFYDIDIDRYMIDGEYRQVMLAPRELTQTLPAQTDTWYNRHLQFTHGYGAVANLVAQEGREGTPDLLSKDLPPRVEDDVFQVDQPAVYYGMNSPDYHIVNTNAQEHHFPAGGENVYHHYSGTGGVQLDSFWKELLFAWYKRDFNIVLSDNIHSESRLQFWNRAQERVNEVAPFLELDQDPYFVISEGRQYWIQDAYTTSTTFPYSERAGDRLDRRNINYIRNSVKIVVDAYTGEVDLYIVEEDDPVLGVYRNVFPELFKPLDEMSEDLRSHIRYPTDIFDLQTQKYNRYHMTNPRTFYNNEDLWERPIENYDGRNRPMMPYYLIMQLPGEDELEFVQIQPLTPDGRENMIAWMAARSDEPHYGELVAYRLPKDRLIYGPSQIEARIDQQTEISRQITLWDQAGSRVLRGNLMVIPIEESFLYIEPIYLISDDVQIPQLQRVVVAYDDRLAMEPTLEASINQIFEAEVIEDPDDEAPIMPSPGAGGVPPEALSEARNLIQEAREALQQGDFGGFGTQFNELEELLQGDRLDTPDEEELPGDMPIDAEGEAPTIDVDVDVDGDMNGGSEDTDEPEQD